MGEVCTSVLSLNLWLNVASTSNYLASYPGLLTPVFVTHSTNAGEGSVKLITCNDIPGRWVNMWRSATYLLYSCKTAFWTQETLPRFSDVEHSVVLWSVFGIWSALTYLRFFWECATPPHIHPMPRYVNAYEQFHQAFPHISTANNKHWGEKAWL